MKIDTKLKELPLTKSNPNTLVSLFGKSDIKPMWVADMDFEISKSIQDALIKRISDSGLAYEYKPSSFYVAQNEWYKRRYSIDLIKDHVLYSPSITTTISVVIENCTSENEGVIIQPPVFMEFRDWFGREGALFMRMNIATTNDEVKKSIGTIMESVSEL